MSANLALDSNSLTRAVLLRAANLPTLHLVSELELDQQHSNQVELAQDRLRVALASNDVQIFHPSPDQIAPAYSIFNTPYPVWAGNASFWALLFWFFELGGARAGLWLIVPAAAVAFGVIAALIGKTSWGADWLNSSYRPRPRP